MITNTRKQMSQKKLPKRQTAKGRAIAFSRGFTHLIPVSKKYVDSYTAKFVTSENITSGIESDWENVGNDILVAFKKFEQLNER